MILVTGATGNVGREAVNLLLEDGQEVAAVTRNPTAAELPGGAHVLGGDPSLMPTLGHTPGHISIVVNTEDVPYFLASDTSYSQSLLIKRAPDGVSPRASVAIDTMDRILGLADSRPLVYLHTHDPESVDRLTEKRTLGESLMPTLGGGARA